MHKPDITELGYQCDHCAAWAPSPDVYSIYRKTDASEFTVHMWVCGQCAGYGIGEVSGTVLYDLLLERKRPK